MIGGYTRHVDGAITMTPQQWQTFSDRFSRLRDAGFSTGTAWQLALNYDVTGYFNLSCASSRLVGDQQ